MNDTPKRSKREAEVIPNFVSSIVIAEGESLSDGINVTGVLQYICMPAEWTSALISFQISPDGTSWYDLFEEAKEFTVNIVAGTAVAISPGSALDNKTWIKIRSGSRDHPIVQEAERTFQVIAT